MTTTNKQDNVSIALGFFDGIHQGHAALLQSVKENGGIPTVLTFQQHPSTLLSDTPVPLLTSTEDRQWIINHYFHISNIIVENFSTICTMHWETFLEDYLQKKHHVTQIVAGHDFRFGKGGEGTPEKLIKKCKELHISSKILPPITLNDKIISSTYIRTLLQEGKMEEATLFLGHPHILSNKVKHGNKIGKNQLGFPTVNLEIPDNVIIPKFGVYACRVWVGDNCYHAVTNIGIRPTVVSENSKTVSVEGYILDFPDQELYGEHLVMEFYTFIRGERKFNSFPELSAQIAKDVESTRSYFQI